MSKLALITGANKGIGLETARQLGKLGIQLLIGARDAKAGEAAAAQLRSEGLSADALLIDVTSAPSIAKAASEVARKHKMLDILVNNAGVLLDDPARTPSAQSLDVWQRTFQANLFGTVAVTQAFLPLLRQAPGARRPYCESVEHSRVAGIAQRSHITDLPLPEPRLQRLEDRGECLDGQSGLRAA
jgi:NAD(P)-dependent dehydrogenase (short-subunit alcohol dehydrogenase family)